MLFDVFDTSINQSPLALKVRAREISETCGYYLVRTDPALAFKWWTGKFTDYVFITDSRPRTEHFMGRGMPRP